MDRIYHEEYTGPRYTYGFWSRPPGYAHNPDGWIIGSEGTHPRYPHGTLDYPRPLTEREVYAYELGRLEGEEYLLVKDGAGTAETPWSVYRFHGETSRFLVFVAKSEEEAREYCRREAAYVAAEAHPRWADDASYAAYQARD